MVAPMNMRRSLLNVAVLDGENLVFQASFIFSFKHVALAQYVSVVKIRLNHTQA